MFDLQNTLFYLLVDPRIVILSAVGVTVSIHAGSSAVLLVELALLAVFWCSSVKSNLTENIGMTRGESVCVLSTQVALIMG